MKPTCHILAILCLLMALAGCRQAVHDSHEFSFIWMLEGDPAHSCDSAWLTDHAIMSSDGLGGKLTAVGGGEDARVPLRYSYDGRRPAVSVMAEDDFLLFEMPVEHVRAGTYVAFDATLGGDSGSPAGYAVEYLEDGVWKDTGCRYFCSGDISTGSGEQDSYEYTAVFSVFRTEKDIRDGNLGIRCRAVTDFACDGRPMKYDACDGATVIPDFGFVAADVRSLGTEAPSDTLKVLALGNSFTYFYGSLFMMKEIAWNEGIFLDITASLKGGQSLGDHLGLSLSGKAVKEGGYDAAILQDQSQNPARYAADSLEYAHVKEDFLELTERIRQYSPECRIILERTWAYPGSGFGGFADFPAFDRLLAEGAEKMAASVENCIVSPVGEAFASCKEEFPEIRLLYADDKHQSEAGSYLKACVEYLVLSGRGFGDDPDDCRISENTAAALRSVAMETVFPAL